MRRAASVDLTARVIAKNLQDSIGQNVIVENKPGANAAIGIDALVRSDPDGHSIIILSDSPVTINVHLAKVELRSAQRPGADHQGGEQPDRARRQRQGGHRLDPQTWSQPRRRSRSATPSPDAARQPILPPS